jgi:hypothetical protein
MQTHVFSGYEHVSIRCTSGAADELNLPRLQAGVCSERFPDLIFAGLVGLFLREECQLGKSLRI